MKKLITVLIALCLMAGLAACGGPKDDEIKTVRNVSFENTELTVTLGTNKSTGYEWEFKIYGDCIKPSINRTFKITGSQGDATGELSIGFEGVSEGSATIVFTTPNGWDGTGAGDGYTVSAAVNADGTIKSAEGKEGAIYPEGTPEPAATPAPTATPEPKTTIAIAELAESTYNGTLSGDSWANSKGTMVTTIPSAELSVTIKDGQVTLYCEAKASADGKIEGEATPHSPEYTVIVSGSLPLAQSSDTVVSAEGDVSMLGETLVIHYTKGKYTHWEVKERDSGSTYYCTVSITMVDGVPTAGITIEGSLSHQTATVPLQLKGEATGELLSTPYAEMLKSGDYQYTYSLTYEGKPYTATIATYNGMICRKVVSDDGSYSQRVVTLDGNVWKVDDLTGAVVDGGAENAETLPDYGATLSFVAAKTLDTGAIAEAYDFTHEGQKCNMVFVFSTEGKLVEIIMTAGDNTSEMPIVSMSAVGNDRSLFDAPKQ